MHPTHSLYKYVWTVRGGHLFNNAYYKNFVKTSDWFIQSWDDDTCTLLGDADGNIPDVKWVPTFEGFTKSGGPMHWIRLGLYNSSRHTYFQPLDQNELRLPLLW